MKIHSVIILFLTVYIVLVQEPLAGSAKKKPEYCFGSQRVHIEPVFYRRYEIIAVLIL